MTSRHAFASVFATALLAIAAAAMYPVLELNPLVDLEPASKAGGGRP